MPLVEVDGKEYNVDEDGTEIVWKLKYARTYHDDETCCVLQSIDSAVRRVPLGTLPDDLDKCDHCSGDVASPGTGRKVDCPVCGNETANLGVHLASCDGGADQ
jgi:anaerobic ribonucleoside-triphosphate reductase